MDYTQQINEILASLELLRGTVSNLDSTVGVIYVQQAATSQTIENLGYLLVGLVSGIGIFLGISFGAKYIAKLLEVCMKWL